MQILQITPIMFGSIDDIYILRSRYNARGRYVVRLYDARSKCFEEIIIDDQIPTLEGTREPAFAKPQYVHEQSTVACVMGGSIPDRSRL